MDMNASKGGVELAEIKRQLLDLGAPEDLVQDWSKVMKYLSKSEDKEKMRSYLESLRGKLAEAPAEVKDAYNKIIMHFDTQIGLFGKGGFGKGKGKYYLDGPRVHEAALEPIKKDGTLFRIALSFAARNEEDLEDKALKLLKSIDPSNFKVTVVH